MWLVHGFFSVPNVYSCSTFCSFKVTSTMVNPFLEGRSLPDAIEQNKIYIVNYKDALEITCRENRKVNIIHPDFFSLLPNSLNVSFTNFTPNRQSSKWSQKRIRDIARNFDIWLAQERCWANQISGRIILLLLTLL